MSQRTHVLAALAIAAGTLSAMPARADNPAVPLCSDYLASTKLGNNPLYVTGSTASWPLIKQMAVAVAADANLKITMIYQGTSSCAGVQQLANDPFKSNSSYRGCTPGSCMYGTATYYSYDPDTRQGAFGQCQLDPAGVHADAAVSDVWAESCLGQPLPATSFAHKQGPAVAMNFVTATPTPSSPALTDTQAYFVFGFSCGGEAQPWTNSKLHFIRTPLSGTEIILSSAIGVPANKLWGIDPSNTTTSGSQAVLNALLNVKDEDAQSSIGFLASSILDDYRPTSAMPNNKLTPLAFRAKGQQYAWFADSSAQSFDKRSMRNGRYPAFGYLHVYTRVALDGQPSPENAKTLTDTITGKMQVQNLDMFSATAKAHYVPLCAMNVQRISDYPGPDGWPQMQPYADPAPCHCAFEAATGAIPKTCQQCTTNNDCAGGTNKFCRQGYCEAR